ncbi:hypothetical protein XENOCAPTIV_002317, partial [Xenoophorus captivus]
ELLGRAAYGHINNAIKPVLMHLDSHSLWEGGGFAVRCFQIIMFSIQVSERYESSNLLTALPSSFLEPLLSFTLMEDPEIRLLVLSILTSLIDRRQNAARITKVRSGNLC